MKPIARFNYMSTDEDWRGFRAAIRITREIMAQPAFDGLCGDEIQPGYAAQTDAEASPPRAVPAARPERRRPRGWGGHSERVPRSHPAASAHRPFTPPPVPPPTLWWQIDEFLIEHLESAYHPCGTCKMGPVLGP